MRLEAADGLNGSFIVIISGSACLHKRYKTINSHFLDISTIIDSAKCSGAI